MDCGSPSVKTMGANSICAAQEIPRRRPGSCRPIASSSRDCAGTSLKDRVREGGAIVPPPLLALASFFVCRSRSFRVLAVGFGSRSFSAAKPSEICCHWLEARLVTSKFSTIVLGGTAASHTCSVWGAVIFWSRNRVRRSEALAEK